MFLPPPTVCKFICPCPRLFHLRNKSPRLYTARAGLATPTLVCARSALIEPIRRRPLQKVSQLCSRDNSTGSDSGLFPTSFGQCKGRPCTAVQRPKPIPTAGITPTPPATQMSLTLYRQRPGRAENRRNAVRQVRLYRGSAFVPNPKSEGWITQREYPPALNRTEKSIRPRKKGSLRNQQLFTGMRHMLDALLPQASCASGPTGFVAATGATAAEGKQESLAKNRQANSASARTQAGQSGLLERGKPLPQSAAGSPGKPPLRSALKLSGHKWSTQGIAQASSQRDLRNFAGAIDPRARPSPANQQTPTKRKNRAR